MRSVRPLCLLVAALLTGCGPSAATTQSKPHDVTSEPWYLQTTAELTEMNREAKELFAKGKADAASTLIQKGEPLSKKLTAVPRPTLAATEAASDLDELYGRMLLSNKNYGWARLMFQKNVARWKYCNPQTAETAERLRKAQTSIAECDRLLYTP